MSNEINGEQCLNKSGDISSNCIEDDLENKQKVSEYIEKYHNHTPQTNPQHVEEESQITYSNTTFLSQ